MKSFTRQFLTTLIVIVLCAGMALGQVRTMSTEELVSESSAILVGTCRTVQSSWNQAHDKIFTEVRIQVSEYLKGNLGPEAVITVPGGRVGNTIYEVSDMPLFAAGEEAVVFVWQHPSGKNLVTGADQGKALVEKDQITGEKLLRISIPPEAADTSTHMENLLLPPPTRRVALDEYLNEVRKFTKER